MAAGGGARAAKGILERLDSGEVIVGDGSFLITLEKRGYVKVGLWTPEAVVEHPSAVRQLHREFLRAGSNVMQTFTFYASEDKLENRGNYVAEKLSGQKVNEAACDIARQVADEGDALVAGGVSQTPSYLSCKSEAEVKSIFQQQLAIFMKKNVDFLIAEYFEHVEEAVWAVETLKTSGKPVAATMCIGPEGDLHGVPPGECAVRLVKAGASIVGVNCHFDPMMSLQTVKLMKEGLAAARLHAYLMSQPLAYHTPDCSKQGFIDLPEFPFGPEPQGGPRWASKSKGAKATTLASATSAAAAASSPYHIRGIAEELAPERGLLARSVGKARQLGQRPGHAHQALDPSAGQEGVLGEPSDRLGQAVQSCFVQAGCLGGDQGHGGADAAEGSHHGAAAQGAVSQTEDPVCQLSPCQWHRWLSLRELQVALDIALDSFRSMLYKFTKKQKKKE
uniref:Betaine--homocysteine S-methyltransferase n=1 Tax=Oryctolagus cuniculus TaxID=9986 RepID=A0A5F9CPN4_RABIT